MISKEQWRTFIDSPVVEWTIFAVGLLLLFVVAPLVGTVPGPGGIIVAGIGLSMVLKTSLWAKRRYVRFKRWEPRVYSIRFKRWEPKIHTFRLKSWRPVLAPRRVNPGRWTDWALRRGSAKRREAIRKEQEQAARALEEGTSD